MNTGLFFSRSLSIGNIYFDGHTSEAPVFSAIPTDHPVEYGANVTDNVIINPIGLKVVAMVNESPLLSLTPNGIFNEFKRTSDALSVLKNAMIRRVPVSVVCNLGLFKNMLITRVEPISDENHVTLISVAITLQEIYYVGEVINEDPTNQDYSSTTNRGALQPKDTPQ